MDTAIVSALAGIFGSLSGGSASVAITWLAHNRRSKREARLAEVAKREALYGEFINECSTRVMDSLERNLDKPETLLSIYALLNRIRLCASDAVLTQAVGQHPGQGDPAGVSGVAVAGQLVHALCVRQVDSQAVSGLSVRALRGRHRGPLRQ